MRHTQISLIEKEVHQFVVSAGSLKYPVTPAVIAERALFVHKRLLKTQLFEEDRRKATQFAASKSWLLSFIPSHAHKLVTSTGEAGSVNVVKVQARIRSLSSALKDFDAKCISDVDETSLVFSCCRLASML